MPYYLKDNNLSFKAKAILALLTHNSELSLRDLAALSSESLGSVTNGMRELVEKGYVINYPGGGRAKTKRELFPDGPVQ